MISMGNLIETDYPDNTVSRTVYLAVRGRQLYTVTDLIGVIVFAELAS